MDRISLTITGEESGVSQGNYEGLHCQSSEWYDDVYRGDTIKAAECSFLRQYCLSNCLGPHKRIAKLG